MTETINGLHKCQPKNEPQQGEVKNMVVLNMPAKNGKKAWIKIKSEKPEKGGSPYRLLNVEKLDWPPDDYGNIAFNIEVEASSSQPTAFQQARSAMTGDEDGNVFTKPKTVFTHGTDSEQGIPIAPQSPPRAQQGESGPMSRDDYWRRKEDRDEQRQKFIIRQHSQSMALEVLKLKVTLNELTVEDLTPEKLRTLSDYFDNDVWAIEGEV